MSFQDELNRINQTTDRTINDCLNSLAGTTNLDSTTACNTYCTTTNLSIQDALNTKVGKVTAAVKQVATITIGGTPEVGDNFSIDLSLTQAIGYTVIAADNTNTKIATKINTAITTDSIYSSLPFTSAVDGAVITFTAKQGGVPFNCAATATNVAEGTDDQTAVYEITTADVGYSCVNLSKQDAAKLIELPS